MKLLFAALLCITLNPLAVEAQEAWLLLYRDDHYAIDVVSGSRSTTIANLGDNAAYGVSSAAIVILSRDHVRNISKLQVVDKASKQLTATWPIDAHAVTHLSGPAAGIVLDDKFAYFATVRYSKDGNTVEPNELGGSFDFNRVLLSNGKHDRYPLPLDIRDPRVSLYENVPLVYSLNGTGVWKFDVQNSKLEQIVSRLDVRDRLAVPSHAPIPASTPVRFSDYVFLTNLGAYRLSRFGSVERILDSQLKPASSGSGRSAGVLGTVSPDSPQLGQVLSSSGDESTVLRTLATSYLNEPAIALVTRSVTGARVIVVDPTSQVVRWSASLPGGTAEESMYGAQDGSFYFVDGTGNSIHRIASSGSETFLSLEGIRGRVDPQSTRILRVTDAMSNDK